MFDDVAGDFFRQREWETHNLFYGGNFVGDFRESSRRIGLGRIRLQKRPGSRQQKVQRRDALAGIDAAATGSGQRHGGKQRQPQKFPV
jgi:hypothetical protein